MKQARREIAKALSSITQLGLSIVISFLLWIMIAAWLRKTFSLGNYIMLIGILLGAGSAVLTLIKFCMASAGKENKNEK